MQKLSILQWKDWEGTSQPINWTTLSKKGECYQLDALDLYLKTFTFLPPKNKFTSFFPFFSPCTSSSTRSYSFWQVSLLHWCSPRHWRCPLHVLPLLNLRPDRKMPCSDNSAVQAPHCGVDELCDCVKVSQKGAFIWDEFDEIIYCSGLDLYASFLN